MATSKHNKLLQEVNKSTGILPLTRILHKFITLSTKITDMNWSEVFRHITMNHQVTRVMISALSSQIRVSDAFTLSAKAETATEVRIYDLTQQTDLI